MFTLNGKKLICILISFNHRLVRDIIYRHGYYIYSNGYHMLCWVRYTYSQGEPIYRQEDHKYSLVISYIQYTTRDTIYIARYIIPIAMDIIQISKNIIWLESTRKYIPSSQLSPNHVQSRRSPWVIFTKKCMNPFAFFQRKVAYRK